MWADGWGLWPRFYFAGGVVGVVAVFLILIGEVNAGLLTLPVAVAFVAAGEYFRRAERE